MSKEDATRVGSQSFVRGLDPGALRRRPVRAVRPDEVHSLTGLAIIWEFGPVFTAFIVAGPINEAAPSRERRTARDFRRRGTGATLRLLTGRSNTANYLACC